MCIYLYIMYKYVVDFLLNTDVHMFTVHISGHGKMTLLSYVHLNARWQYSMVQRGPGVVNPLVKQ